MERMQEKDDMMRQADLENEEKIDRVKFDAKR